MQPVFHNLCFQCQNLFFKNRPQAQTHTILIQEFWTLQTLKSFLNKRLKWVKKTESQVFHFAFFSFASYLRWRERRRRRREAEKNSYTSSFFFFKNFQEASLFNQLNFCFGANDNNDNDDNDNDMSSITFVFPIWRNWSFKNLPPSCSWWRRVRRRLRHANVVRRTFKRRQSLRKKINCWHRRLDDYIFEFLSFLQANYPLNWFYYGAKHIEELKHEPNLN